MFAAAASGALLPPYVCYKAECLYTTWTEKGPQGARYNCTKLGWFAKDIFVDWFTSLVIPWFCRKPGCKVIIGDNLASHISYSLVVKALDEGINFVFLPPNATHLCQPLDVCVFKAVKSSWCVVLRGWKKDNTGALQKSAFPELLQDTIHSTINMERNIISGFRQTGICPLRPDIVLRQVPDEEDELEIGKRYMTPVIALLQAHR
jgi:hypothetical protein